MENQQRYGQLNTYNLFEPGTEIEASNTVPTATSAEFQKILNEDGRKREDPWERLEAEEREKHIQDATSMELPMDWENFYAEDETVADNQVETIPDGLVKCMNVKGCVDIEYIAAISDSDCKTVIERLKGAIYQNPEKWDECFYKGWETAEEYLSGNIRRKLETARIANNEYHGYFDCNVEALEKVIPPQVCAGDIYATLGSPWIPEIYLTQFIYDIIRGEERKVYSQGYCRKTSHYTFQDIYFFHDSETGTWECNNPRYKDWMFDQKYGTSARPAIDIFMRTLNMQSVEVLDTVSCATSKSGKKTVVNKAATLEAVEKQKLLIRAFEEWVWSNSVRKEELEKIYNGKFGSIKQRHFDGSFLELRSMEPTKTLYGYQKNAVARILFSRNTLLAHDVGAGKTYIMIAAGMELKRLGISKKNLYVVPNNIIGQWRRLFYELYPEANILCIEPKDFTPKQREGVLGEVKNGDYDAIIMTYSSFTEIGISRNCRIKVLKEEAAKLDSIPKNRSSTRLKRKKRKIDDALDKLRGKGKLVWNRETLTYERVYEKPDGNLEEGICFDDLGITRLFVDEAHNFKNVPIETKIEEVMGISSTGSKKCQDMMDKVQIVQHDGGGVIFATGTPITNSITDVFIMQKYLQSGDLALLELNNFDSWVGMFAEKNTGFEVDVDTSNFRMATRFSKFHNIPELTNILAGVADFHQMDEVAGVPKHDGYDDIVVHRTAEFQNYLEQISRRADNIRHGRVRRDEDNLLIITTDGRRAALDMRLVNPNRIFTTSSKVFECAQKVAEIYKTTLGMRSTQLVFCDTSTPKDGFNIYDELKGLLIKMGVAEGEIAYVHDATTERARERMFESVRRGIIRVLIGSTFKLGLGVNVQTKLIALHHLDVPWRPSDMIQREGRILRQGNENEKVKIYRYITEGSFDAYSWQLLETKQRFITDILSGSIDARSGSDVDDTVLDYAEVKALAIGNPLIKKRVEVTNELMKYLILQKKVVDRRMTYEAELPKLKERSKTIKELIPKVKADAANYKKQYPEYTPEQRQNFRSAINTVLKSEEPLKEDEVVAFYKGFAIVVPKNASVIHPVIYLQNAGRYMVEADFSENRLMSKIDAVLDGLENRADELEDRLSEAKGKITYIEAELKSDAGYASEINDLRKKLTRIDKQLGVGE